MMGTGRSDDKDDDMDRSPVFPVFFQLIFFSISHQHSQNHEQCGHAEAIQYSDVILGGGNSQESNMPS